MSETATAAMTAAVETTDLTKRYDNLVAVDAINMTVARGEVYGFLGPNGAGKTTTLRMLLGLVRPTSGSIRLLDGVPVSAGLARVGALIEGPAFYPFLSGRDNLRALAARGRVAGGRVGEVLELVDLAGRANDRYATYSLGMKQRLGLAAALLKRPELLVLDEPTSGLDPAGMADMRATIRRLADQGRTVLLSSHLLDEVRQICDRVGVINRGRLVIQQTIGELGGTGWLRVVADPLAWAADTVERLLDSARVRIDGNALELDVDASMAANINRTLVAAGVAVHELRWHQPDLERVFFDLTGGEPDVA